MAEVTSSCCVPAEYSADRPPGEDLREAVRARYAAAARTAGDAACGCGPAVGDAEHFGSHLYDERETEGATATVVLNSDPVTLGSATANAAGQIVLQATIPTDTPLGSHTLVASGQAPNGQTLSLSLAIEVVPAQGGGTGTSGGNLPRTGDSTSLPLAKVGLGLLAVGGVIYSIAAKRRKALSVSR